MRAAELTAPGNSPYSVFASLLTSRTSRRDPIWFDCDQEGRASTHCSVSHRSPRYVFDCRCDRDQNNVSAAGTDLILADLVAKGMKAGNLPTRVKTGRSMFWRPERDRWSPVFWMRSETYSLAAQDGFSGMVESRVVIAALYNRFQLVQR